MLFEWVNKPKYHKLNSIKYDKENKSVIKSLIFSFLI